MPDILEQDIMYLPGVGPKRKEILAKELQINTWGDLLEYYPYKYVDRSKVYTINELNGNMPFVQLKGKILSFEEFATTPRKKRLVAHFSDGHGVVDLVWFRGVQYVSKTYQLGVEYIVFGKPSVYGGRFQFAHPEMEEATTLQLELQRAQVRLKFEELFYVQLNILRYAHDRRRKYSGYRFHQVGQVFHQFYENNLPFALTDAQKRVMHEIRADMDSGKQMNRLLQGDVGSGKTLVALMTMLIAIGNGFQACIMAPTEILAEQHFVTIKEFLHDMPVEVALLTGVVKGKRRQTLLERLAKGEINILVGTHAIIEDTVQFARLGLAVVDEQHRFGVAQRARLWAKSEQPPHILVMTATPIPRTLAMTIYGDLEVSVIDELPPGRKPIETLHKYDTQITSLYQGIRQQIEQGRQVYVVFPLIKENEKNDLKDLEKGYENLCEIFPQYAISKVHGKLKPAEKEEEMRKFVQGETQILVATTVIEVGVNVPNASVMVIMDAQRFGLSQLHQLRGRVGRGAKQSYCILVTGYKLSEETRKRIDIMCETNDGFRIAEADLKLRGPGDLEGTQQSGIAFDLKIANIARDGQLVQMAREVAQKIIESDPLGENPAHQILWQRLKALRKTNVNWAAIS